MTLKNTSNQKGFAHIGLVLVLIVLIAIGLVGYKVFNSQKHKNNQQSTSGSSAANVSAPNNDIIMKSIGFNLDYYNETTNRAGDMEFTKVPLMFDQIWGDFGQQDPRTPNDPTKRNPQPVYILPLGTKVQSLIDGTVTKVETLYSGDTTIWVSPNQDSQLNFETEHVSHPLVKVGDKVKSGQIIAQVSEYDAKNHPGFGSVEIGVLGQSGSQPVHSCPYQYLDASVKDDILKKITSLHAAWEKYLNKDIYGDTYALPGCVTTDPVNG